VSIETARVIDAVPTLVMVISYWGYVLFLPLMIVAVVVFGWLVPRNR
jgi:hypothetical protein